MLHLLYEVRSGVSIAPCRKAQETGTHTDTFKEELVHAMD
jgi:hypothetical protein